MGIGLFSVTENVNACLLGQIQQSATDAQTLLMWTNSTLEKTHKWLIAVNGTLVTEFESHNSASGIANWIEQNTSDLTEWTSATVLQLQTYVAGKDTGSGWNAVVGDVGSLASMVSSAMTQDTARGNTESKNTQSQLQMDNSAQQPIANFGNAWTQTLSSLANVLGQMSVS